VVAHSTKTSMRLVVSLEVPFITLMVWLVGRVMEDVEAHLLSRFSEDH
jgi:hypothetical protein